jgi:hypothetical protein
MVTSRAMAIGAEGERCALEAQPLHEEPGRRDVDQQRQADDGRDDESDDDIFSRLYGGCTAVLKMSPSLSPDDD